jgi:predicted DNA-binding protein with PD1-like motif
MHYKLLQAETGIGPRTFMLVFESGEELIASLERFAQEQDLPGGHFQGIGALRSITLAYYNAQSEAYEDLPVDEQVELVSLLGNLAVFEGGWMVHAHALVGKSDGSVLGGHVMQAIVHPRAEVILQVPAGGLRRLRDPQTGLAAIEV